MTFTILCPTDFSAASDRALEYAIQLAEPHGGATIRLLYVDDLPTYGLPEGSVMDEPLRRAWRAQLEERRARLADRVDVEPVLGRGRPSSEILAAAERADLVVMSTRGRNALGRALLGSVAQKVVRASAAPVLTLDPEARADPPRSILVMLELPAGSERALAEAFALASRHDAQLHVAHAIRLPLYPSLEGGVYDPELADQLRGDAEIAIAEVLARHPTSSEVRVHVGEGAAADVAGALVEELGVDLVVMGTHGRSGLSRLFLGSVAERMVRTCPVPVMVARHSEAGDGSPTS